MLLTMCSKNRYRIELSSVCRLLALAAGLLMAGPAGAAALRWERTEQVVDSSLADTSIAATFRFSNPHDQPVVILDVRHSCGCTTSDLDNLVLEPGQQGELVVRMSLSGLKGEQAKTVSVYTSADESNPDILYLYTDVPERHRISPAIVSWVFRSRPKASAIRLVFHPDLPFRLEDIEAVVEDRDGSGLEFDLQVAMGASPAEVLISLTPRDTRRMGHSYLAVYWNRGGQSEKIGDSYLLVH